MTSQATQSRQDPPQGKLASGTFQIAAATGVSVLAAFARHKALAVLLGAGGIGVYGLLLNFLSTLTAIAGLGLSFSITGALGRLRDHKVRQLALIANIVIGVTLSGAVIAVGFEVVTQMRPDLLGGDVAALNLGLWLVPVLLLMLWFQVMTAGLMGLQRQRAYSLVTAASAIASTPPGIAMVWWLGAPGLIWMVVIPYMTGVAFVLIALGRWRAGTPMTGTGLGPSVRVLRELTPTGVYFMLGTAGTTAAILLSQAMIARDLGLEAVGGMQAVYALSLQAVAFVTLSLQSSFFPAVAGVTDDREAMRALANRHMRFTLVLTGLALMIVALFAAPLLRLLFTAEFAGMSGFLALWLVGDMAKVLTWVPGLMLIALGHKRPYLLSQLSGATAFVATVWIVLAFDLPFAWAALAQLAFWTVAVAICLWALWPEVGGLFERRVWTLMAEATGSLMILAGMQVWDMAGHVWVGLALGGLFAARHGRLILAEVQSRRR